MKNPLNKRLPREIRGDVGKYLVIFLLLVLSRGLISGTVLDKEHRYQNSGTDQGTHAVKGKRTDIFHTNTLGYKGDSPDSGSQEQAERIFQRHFL